MVTFNSKQEREGTTAKCKNGGSFFKPVIQTKLTVNDPGDKYEQEADAVADKVMRMADPQNDFFESSPAVQRKCQQCEENERLHRKEKNNEAAQADGELETYVNGLGPFGYHMPEDVRSFYEPRFGRDFGNVKVHTDPAAAKSAESINALAYTSGNNIVFGAGQYQPETDAGKRLLGHELTHVIQQGGSDVAKFPLMRKGLYGQGCELAPAGDRREEEQQSSPGAVQTKQVMRKPARVETDSYNRISNTRLSTSAKIIQRYTLSGFPATEEAQMRAAIPVAASTVTSCRGLKKTVVEKINDANYLYKPDLGLCGKTYPAPWADIRIGSDAFNFQKCCALASTIAHEASHTQFYTEGDARELECACFNCSC